MAGGLQWGPGDLRPKGSPPNRPCEAGRHPRFRPTCVLYRLCREVWRFHYAQSCHDSCCAVLIAILPKLWLPCLASAYGKSSDFFECRGLVGPPDARMKLESVHACSRDLSLARRVAMMILARTLCLAQKSMVDGYQG